MFLKVVCSYIDGITVHLVHDGICTCSGIGLRRHVYVFKFIPFHLREKSSKLLGPHERFFIVFASENDKAGNGGSVR